jgi:hypothetical protein
VNRPDKFAFYGQLCGPTLREDFMNSEQNKSYENITITRNEKKRFQLLVKTTVSLEPPLPHTIIDEIALFWTRRRIIILEITDETMTGKRGGLWWNAFTFDMSKLRSALTISIDKNHGIVECSLDINTILQLITPMNQMYWVEEMAAFESSIRTGDDKKEEWDEFRRVHKKENIRWFWRMVTFVGITIIGSQIIGGLLSWLIGLMKASK